MKTLPLSGRQIELGTAALVAVAMLLLIVYVQLRAIAERNQIPRLEPIAVIPDFAAITDVDAKKQQFFDYLQDYIAAENRAILALREEIAVYVAVVSDNVGLSPDERARVMELADVYSIDSTELGDRGLVTTLMRRADIIPVSLALAQAANESAWGTSRFTLEGNNLFGQWCYDSGCGIVPLRRREGASHEVEEFSSVAESVRAYFRNINTHPSYQNLREMRESMRNRDQPLDSLRLASGLARYSERGVNYVDELQTLIKQNNLLARDG